MPIGPGISSALSGSLFFALLFLPKIKRSLPQNATPLLANHFSFSSPRFGTLARRRNVKKTFYACYSLFVHDSCLCLSVCLSEISIKKDSQSVSSQDFLLFSSSSQLDLVGVVFVLVSVNTTLILSSPERTFSAKTSPPKRKHSFVGLAPEITVKDASIYLTSEQMNGANSDGRRDEREPVCLFGIHRLAELDLFF